MITQDDVIKSGYEVIPNGAWLRINPEIMPRDWHDVAKDFGFNQDAKNVILCVVGYKEEV